MIEKTIKEFATSSVNPEQASLSLKGLLIANLGLIMLVLNYFGLTYSAEEVTNIIGIVSGLVGAVIMAIGLIRKLIVAVKARKQS